MKPVLIVENSTSSLIREFVDTAKKDYVMSGIFTEFGIKNRNERVYTAEKYLPALAELNERINFGVNENNLRVLSHSEKEQALSYFEDIESEFNFIKPSFDKIDLKNE